MAQTTCVSAPGKVLIAGGYLVLDRAHSGVVVSTSSRFYTIIQNGSESNNIVRVKSLQFEGGEWVYSVDASVSPVKVGQQGSSGRNKFVELAIQRTLSLAFELRGSEAIRSSLASGLVITIAGANDFYSQRASLSSRNLPPTRSSLASLPPFLPTGTTLKSVHKTGLGSSAALITSLVTALLVHTGVIQRSDLSSAISVNEARRLAHNLAQHVHCLAQGKVGSGFDVSAAVFGSQLYTRFSPSVLEPLMVDDLPGGGRLSSIIASTNKAWDYIVKPFKLPPLVRLMLADVDAGSDTPSLVGKVLKWRSFKKEEADALWSDLDHANNDLAHSLSILADAHAADPKQYASTVHTLSTLPSKQWNSSDSPALASSFYAVYTVADRIRKYMRDMSLRADVPIEPPEQTALLDACVELPGVLGGGVPGAGGYDAIWVLVLDPASPERSHPSVAVETLWANWKALSVSPLLAEESVEGGCRIESVEDVPGLRAGLRM